MTLIKENGQFFALRLLQAIIFMVLFMNSSFATNIPDDVDVSMKKDLRCLARNIYYEARGESRKGKIAVAQVTVNRVNTDKFPDSICGVVYQKSKIEEKHVCQFSWFCKKDKNHIVDAKAYDESYEVAKLVLLEGVRLQALKHALFFHAKNVTPAWKFKKRRLVTIGNHVYYGVNVR